MRRGIGPYLTINPAASFTRSPVTVDLLDEHLVISGMLYDADCLAQTWLQDCRVEVSSHRVHRFKVLVIGLPPRIEVTGRLFRQGLALCRRAISVQLLREMNREAVEG